MEAADGSGFGVFGCVEAVSPGGIVRVRVGRDGRTLGVRLSIGAMSLSAAELAADILCLNVLGYMRVELAQEVRARHEVVAYARFVAAHCGRRRPGAVPVAAKEVRGAALQAAAREHDGLARRVLDRMKRIEALLAAAPVNLQSASDEGDVVVSVDSAGRLVGLSLAPGCTSRHTAAELEELLNSALGVAGASAAVSGQPISA
ncbi:hypothetical protein [Mycobacterium arosiense]|uniref:hypothetical protein n=1 Tax=Mycobacterium arosiense TaxID=425468 RepID=UPI001150AA7D|nr:hypothetical protein [Mycobacterium arosiense]